MRGNKVRKKVLLIDSVYKSKVVTRMINILMFDGKKSIARGAL